LSLPTVLSRTNFTNTLRLTAKRISSVELILDDRGYVKRQRIAGIAFPQVANDADGPAVVDRGVTHRSPAAISPGEAGASDPVLSVSATCRRAASDEIQHVGESL
jgi:hypothetical protein